MIDIKNTDIIDNMSELVLIENEVGVIKYVNKAFCIFHGINYEDAIGKSCFDFIIPQDRDICNVENLVTPANPYYRIEGRSKRIDGKIIWIQYIGRAYFDEEGKRIEFQEIGVDITEWKEKIEEKALELAKANEQIVGKFHRNAVKVEAKKYLNSRNGKFSAMHRFSDIYTANSRMKSIMLYAKSVAKGEATIMIEGESGTGKELFAQAIHNESKRANGPFVAVNCGVIPADLISSEFFGYVEGAFTGAVKGGKPGKFEMASGGTLFLDEIGEMPLNQQVALLRVIENRSVVRVGDDKEIPVDVRIICATNKNLYKEVQKGNFRSDLYYRLNVINLRIPPLRERKEDIFLLIGAFIKKYGSNNFDKNKSFTDDKLIALYKHNWPGNVRELQNVVHRMMYLQEDNEDIFFDYLISDLDKNGENNEKISEEKNERNEIMKLMITHENNISIVARKMKISRNTLYKKLSYYDIKY